MKQTTKIIHNVTALNFHKIRKEENIQEYTLIKKLCYKEDIPFNNDTIFWEYLQNNIIEIEIR